MKLVYTNQIKNPRRVSVNVEAEIWKKLQHLRLDRSYETGHPQHGISVLVEEALQAWLPGEERKERTLATQATLKKIQDPRRIIVNIEDETYARVRYIAVHRGYAWTAVHPLFQEALEMLFLEEEREK